MHSFLQHEACGKTNSKSRQSKKLRKLKKFSKEGVRTQHFYGKDFADLFCKNQQTVKSENCHFNPNRPFASLFAPGSLCSHQRLSKNTCCCCCFCCCCCCLLRRRSRGGRVHGGGEIHTQQYHNHSAAPPPYTVSQAYK